MVYDGEPPELAEPPEPAEPQDDAPAAPK
jgi:hypothetical protein